MATIRKRGEFSWHVQVRVRGYPPQTKTFIKHEDAVAWAKETEVAMQRGLFFDRSPAERTTVADLVKQYREEVLPSKRGRHFGPCLDAIEAEFGPYAVASVTSSAIATWRDKGLKKEKLAASTVRKRINTLSKLLDLASKEWGCPIAANPVKQVSKPPERNARSRRLSPIEAKWLLVGADESENPQLRPLIETAIETGARLGELLSIERKDVDLKAGVLTVRGLSGEGSKNGEIRRVPLTKRARVVFKALPAGINQSRVFYSWGSPEATRIVWQKTLRRAKTVYHESCRKAGKKPEPGVFEDLVFHDLRHEAASRLAGKLSAQELCKMMGWKTLQMAMRYYHPTAEDLVKKVG